MKNMHKHMQMRFKPAVEVAQVGKTIEQEMPTEINTVEEATPETKPEEIEIVTVPEVVEKTEAAPEAPEHHIEL